jgi:hypothetical protein
MTLQCIVSPPKRKRKGSEQENAYMTGALMVKTAFHSIQFNGIMANRPCKKGIYRIAKWSVMERIMA